MESEPSIPMTSEQPTGGLTDSAGRYVDSADARMRRVEENLDVFIRAITAEHSTGRGKS
jgi:hypothetical protein